MVNLNRIYTRTGDAGSTRLSDLSEVRKTDPRVEAYGAVDEANAILGLVVTRDDLPAAVREVLRHVQNELFDAGADLSNPLAENPPYEPLRITQQSIDRLEGWCDEFGDPLPNLRSFILPGGTFTAALLHQARSVVRRAEREAWRAVESYGTEPAGEDSPGGVNLLAVTYLNRLSDLLFILARAASVEVGEVLWVPGGERRPSDPKGRRQRERILSQASENATSAGGPDQVAPPPAS
ncbi:MAG: cob(I)yrinic acid a,c-diamide adenosyltransferase [Propionicimonas sp.]|uniref:cob(I)yrinic acid a,c-diamide adenosyltransferase n=1 Tax=Propionicimonas sp. TaxID=1955623 RepID=UPI002B20452C|nr:cob(I)yrinic acid a,c-diamide adenosyltransferase [Propionicimonas sp.]MEA4943161.1 cob(I)yrinic acid a,c-diamide adenosyltransferase [Propionicimonas sp.]MEA5054767.1 cob(I)yrinic acid a,c-diamide adenosyltransferase [Propionicimonas sp.]